MCENSDSVKNFSGHSCLLDTNNFKTRTTNKHVSLKIWFPVASRNLKNVRNITNFPQAPFQTYESVLKTGAKDLSPCN